MRKQTAVYWPPEGTFDDYGVPQLGVAREIACRWDDQAEEFVDSEGTRYVSRAKVYVPESEDVKIGGVLFLGELADLTDVTPKENNDAYEVRRVDKNPNLKASETLVTAVL
jgi:hypothetical protein